MGSATFYEVNSSPDIRSSPSAETLRRKKVYQKTRFSTEIPMIKRPKSTPTPPPPPPPTEGKSNNSIGDTFRKIIGKLQGNNTVEKKHNARNGRNDHAIPNGVSRHSSMRNHQQNQSGSYQEFNNSVDHHIIPTHIESSADVGGMTDRSGQDSPSLFKPKQASKYASYNHSNDTRATTTKKRGSTSSPTRRSPLINGGSQTLDRNYRTSAGLKRTSPTHKYYLNEDPLADDHNSTTKPFRRKSKNGNSTDDEKKSVKTQFMNGVHNLLAGKMSKSNGKVASSGVNSNRTPRVRNINIDYTDRGVQTLPRKSKKQVFINDPASDQENVYSRRTMYHYRPGSMINVSVLNNHSPNTLRNGQRHYSSSSFNSSNNSYLAGPQKPARSFGSSLLRSKSLNVHSHPTHNSFDSTFKLNQQLHKLDKLDESPPPLKSPGIVTSISRSTRDLSKYGLDDAGLTNGFSPSRTSFTNSHFSNSRGGDLFEERREEYFTLPSSIRNKHKTLDYSKSFHGSTNTTSHKPTVSFESDRHSNLNKTYTTLGRYSSSDRNGINKINGTTDGVSHRSVSRTGSNDDYSETVRITSKSNNPLRPSVTNTVQSFSKKTLPSKDGRIETIESSETTKVTKSHLRGDGDTTKFRPSSRNGGINIEIKNERN